jgi:hypothetical protein
MAVPSYITDLTDIYLDTDNFTVVGGGRVTAAETDDFIQGNNCWSHDPFSSGTEGGVYDTVTAETITADDAVFIWMKCDVAATIAAHASGGMAALIGDAATALKVYYVRGSDDYQYGGWICVPVDPTITPSANIGSPSGVWDHFGVQWYVPSTGASKGYPMKIDAMRHGRQIEVTAGEVANPATWTALAAHDATSTRQWGICQPNAAGVELQGIIYWGTATTACHFDDSSGETTLLIDTEWTSTDFTKIIIDHASTVFNMDGRTIKALGTNNPGQLIFNNASTVSALKNNNFDSIGITTLRAGVTSTSNKWKAAGTVTQNGATLTTCTFDKPSGTVGLLVDDLDLVDGCVFNSGGTGHAVDLGTYAADDSIGWGNTDSGYALQAGTAGNRTILCNVPSGVTLTINVGTGASTPTYYNEAGSPGTVTVVSSFDHVLTGLELGTEVTYVTADTNTELFHVESASVSDGDGKYKTTYQHGGGASVDILIMHNSYKPEISNIYGITLPSSDTSVKVQMFLDENYIAP